MFTVKPILYACIVTAVIVTGCGKESRCGKSTGEIQTITRDLPAFDSLSISDKIDLELRPSTVNRVTLTCGANLADYIVTEVKNGRLDIYNDNACNFLRSYKKPVKIILEYTSMWRINFVCAGTVTCTDTLVQPYLQVEARSSSGDFDLTVRTDSIRFNMHTGNSNVNVNGKTGRAYFYSGGTSIIKAQAMQTNYCFVNNSGSGNFEVNAINYLYVNIGNQGDVYYSGNPAVDEDKNGSGELIHQ